MPRRRVSPREMVLFNQGQLSRELSPRLREGAFILEKGVG
jgi:hypothetical protein